jgi:hypothetical protein
VAQTWTELLDDIKVRGMIPTSQNTFTEARLLRLTKAAILSKVMPLADRVQEGFYSYDFDTLLNATGLYDINRRAVGAKLLDAFLVVGDDTFQLTRYFEQDLQNADSPPGDYGFVLKRNQVRLVPRVPSAWTHFRQTILLQPANLVSVDDAAQITGIDTVTGVVTCATVPSSWTTGDTFDTVQAEAHFDTLSLDLVASAVVTGALGTLTFAPADLDSRLAVGDWVSLSGESPVVQVPEALLPLLAQEVANIALKSQTDQTAYKLGIDEVKEMRQAILTLVSPRVRAAGKKIVNRTGILRRGM